VIRLARENARWGYLRRALPPPPPGAAGDQLTVPSQHGLESDQKAAPAIARQHAGKGGEQHPVLGAETGPTLLALQHVELVAQDQDLDVFGRDFGWMKRRLEAEGGR
jgi:hypothetical protein